MLDHLPELITLQDALHSISDDERAFLDRWHARLEAVVAPAIPQQPQIPGYIIEKELGRGGLGKVYLAWDETLQRHVAIKQLHIEPDSEERHRLREEAQLAAGLKHHGIVQVYSMTEHRDRLLLVMEYLEGGSLADRLHQQLFESDDAARLMIELAESLDYAHRQGIVHRDVKPSNILLTLDGNPKLADFGLAKRLEENNTLSGTAAIVGTPSYMAPEQAAGRTSEIGPASDIHALGCVLYECLTGRAPFRAAQPLETLLQTMLDDATPIRKLQPRVPVDLETICLHCLRKKPQDRYASASALREDLDRYLQRLPIHARPVNWWQLTQGWIKRKPVHAAAAIFSIVLLAVILGFLWSLTGAQAELAHSQAMSQVHEYYRIEATIRHRSQQRPLNWVNDNLNDIGKVMKLTGATPNLELLRSELVRALSSHSFTKVRQLDPGLGKIAAAAYAPDGKTFALAQGTATDRTTCSVDIRDAHTLERVELLTFPAEEPRDLGKGKELWDGVRTVAYSPDGQWLFAGTRGGKLARWNLCTRAEQPDLMRVNMEGISCIKATSDGKRILGLSHPFATVPTLYEWDMSTLRETMRLILPRPCVWFLLDDQAHSVVCYSGTHLYLIDLQKGSVNEIHQSTIPQETMLGKGLFKLHRLDVQHMTMSKAYGLQAINPSNWHDQLRHEYAAILVHKPESASIHMLELHGACIIGSCPVQADVIGLAMPADRQQVIVLTSEAPDVVNLAFSPIQGVIGSETLPILDSQIDTEEMIIILGEDLKPRMLRPTTSGWARSNHLPYLKLTDEPQRHGVWLSKDGRHLACKTNSNLMVMDTTDGRMLHQLPLNKVHATLELPNGVMWVAHDKLVRLYNLRTRKWLDWQPEAHPDATRNANVFTMTASAQHLATGDHEGNISLFRLGEEPVLHCHVSALKDWLQHIEFSHDGTTLTVATRSGRLHLVDVSTGKLIYSGDPHADVINHVAWISQGLLVTASSDRTLQWHRWDGATLKHLFTMEMNAPAKRVHYIHSKGHLVVHLENETASRYWDVTALLQKLTEYGLGIGKHE